MAAVIDFDALPAQAECFDDDETGTLLYSGGLGSGKTYYLCMKALKLSYLNKNYAGGYLCPSYASFKKDVYPTFVDILENNGIKYKYHKTDKTFRFPWTKAPLYIFTAEKPIAGPNLAYCLINEYSLIHYDRISEMLRRVRIKNAKFKQKCMAGTPEDLHGWLEEFIENQEEMGNFRIVYADTLENHHIDVDYRKYLESILDEQSLKVFAGGHIVRIGGKYFYYSFDKEKVADATCVKIAGKDIHVGMDFNVGRMTASFSHKLWLSNRWEQHFFDEILLTHENANTYDLSDSICKRYGDPEIVKEATKLKGETFHDKWIQLDMPVRKAALAGMVVTCDAAGKNRSTAAQATVMSDVKILRLYGFNVRLKNSNTRLRKRQLLVNGLLFHGRIKAHPKRCKNLIMDWKNVQQNPDYTKKKDKDFKLTHFSDGADYVFDFEYKLPQEENRQKITLYKGY